MASLNLGKVGLLLRGDWDSDTDYAALDVVSHEGYAYAARVANKNVEPSAETAAYWQPLAESASVLATMLGYKNDAADSATAAAGSATAAATSASSATDALANEAADFSSSKAYAIGDYVIYNNGTHKYLYRFTAAHSAGAWVGTDVTQVALADDVSDLKSAFELDESNLDSVTECTGKNLFDQRILSAKGISESEGVYSSTVTNLAEKFGSSTDGLTIKGGFKENQRYTLSMKIKNTGNVSTESGWGINFTILYTNGTTRDIDVSRALTSFASRTLTSEASKTVSKIYIKKKESPGNVWEIKEMQIEEGTSATTYEAYKINAIDEVGRNNLSSFETYMNTVLSRSLAFDLYPGYYGSDGNINSQSGSNKEQYTNKIDCLPYKSVDWTLTYSASKSAWLCACVWYKNGTFSRITLKNESGASFSGAFAIDNTMNKMCFTFRSFDESPFSAVGKVNVGTVPDVIERVENKQNNRTAYFPVISDKKLIDHLFVEQVTSDLTQNIVIPCQSIFHVAYSARLGFKYIEGNVQKTATTGKYIVTHGIGGKLGKDFQTTGGGSATDVTIASTSYDDLRSGYKYISQNPQYEVPPTSLEEFLYACRENNLFPLLQYRDDTMLDIARGIVGNNMILYDGNHDVFDGFVTTYHSFTTKAEIIAQCEKIGAPYIYGMGNPSAFTDSDLMDIVETIHKMGCYILVSSAYTSKAQTQRCMQFGFDLDSAGDYVNPFETGNVATLNKFDEWTWATGVAESDGKLTIPNGKNISSGDHSGGLIKWCCKIMFSGTLKIDNKEFTSDGTHVVYVSGFKLSGSHNLWIVAQADTDITMLKYVVESC